MIKKIAVFTGTRAEYGLLYWVLKDIAADEVLELQLIVSGTHLSPHFGNTISQIQKDGFEIAAEVDMLLSSDTATGTVKSMGLATIGYADALARLKPDAMVLLGDRFEALAMAQTAMIMKIPLLHIHGGEITEGAYDDAIRHAITKLSHYHFTSNSEHRNRVIQLGESPERVFDVGAIGLDHIHRSQFFTVPELAKSIDFPLHQPYFLVTYHPVTLADESPLEAIDNLIFALSQFQDHQVIITYPNADDGGHGIIKKLRLFAAENRQKVFLTASLGQQRYLSAVKHAAAVIGNSSSGIIEVPSFGVPTVNIGSRQTGRAAAASVINCSESKQEISAALQKALSKEFSKTLDTVKNPYGQGNVSASIVNFLKNHELNVYKQFFDIKWENT
ncbi:MAG: UDP-N-acetylglucosamine 2-epimerase [Aestuariibacter sp.]